MHIPYKKQSLAFAISVAACSLAMTASAAEGETTTDAIMLEELVVTAQKREQSMQDTPISMNAFGSQALEDKGVSDISDVSNYVPNVQITESPGGSTGATIGIRGSVTINPAVTWEPTVGVYVDGVFVAKNVGGLFEVAELERIEVLRGPQGTLYGKNTVGGAINLISRKPGEEAGGTIKLGVGNYNYTEGFVSVDSGRVGDMAQFNIAVNKRDRAGFYDNLNNDAGVADKFKELDSTAARFAALLDLTDDLELYYTYDMSDKDNTPAYGQFDHINNDDADSREEQGSLNGTKFDTSETEGHALHLTWNAMDELTIKSITAYREMSFHDFSDYDGFTSPVTPVDVDGTTYYVSEFHAERQFDTDQFSQEFQFVGTAGPVDYVVGAYYLYEDTVANNPFHMWFSPASNYIEVGNQYGVEGDSYALFGQADWHITDALTWTVGLRWTEETKTAWLQRQDPTDLNPAVPTQTGDLLAAAGSFGGTFVKTEFEETWDNVSPMTVISYLWENGINTYFKVAQGWKAGGFNGEAGQEVDYITDPLNPTVSRTALQTFSQPYDEEKVTSYELGMKSRWLDSRLQVNAALFYDDIEDLQISDFLGAYSEVRNAGEATVQGLELEVMAMVSDNVTLNVNYGYLDGEYDSFVLTDPVTGLPDDKADEQKYRYAPKNTFSAGVQYVEPVANGELRASLDVNFNDDHYVYDNPQNAEATKIKAYALLSGRIGVANMDIGNNQTLDIGFWGKNLTDEEYRINGIPVVGYSAAGQQKTVGGANYYGNPRTFGADMTFRF